jgi:hypothetical protein
MHVCYISQKRAGTINGNTLTLNRLLKQPCSFLGDVDIAGSQLIITSASLGCVVKLDPIQGPESMRLA